MDIKASIENDDSLSPYFNVSKDGSSTQNTRKINLETQPPRIITIDDIPNCEIGQGGLLDPEQNSDIDFNLYQAAKLYQTPDVLIKDSSRTLGTMQLPGMQITKEELALYLNSKEYQRNAMSPEVKV